MSRDTNFYYSFLVLPADKRRAIVAAWDFCRAIDDAVDRPEEGSGTAAQVLAEWRRELARCFGGPDGPAEAGHDAGRVDGPAKAGHYAGHDAGRVDGPAENGHYAGRYAGHSAEHVDGPAEATGRAGLDKGGAGPVTAQGQALQSFVARFGLPRRAFEDVIDGVEMDLDASRRYPTFDDLREYCLRVASAVGLICLEIFGYRNPGARDYAVDLGIALQLTNIVRDVSPDLARGRVYLPLEDLARFGCCEQDLRDRPRSGRVSALLKFQCERARGFYARAHAALPREDARRLVAAEIMAAIYFAILRRIERRGYDVFSEVVRIPRPRRALIAAATWARIMVRRQASGVRR